MTQDPNAAAVTPSDPTPAPVPRKRRRWLWVLAALFVGLLLLVLLTPTIAGLPPMRSVVVSKINRMLNGRIEIGSYSVGWFTPISARGIKLYDEKNRLIADVPNVKVNLTLLQAIRQKFHLGQGNQVDVASFVLDVDENNQTNFQKLLKTEPKTEVKVETKATTKAVAEKQEPLPDVSGEITVNFAGTVEGAGVKQPVQIDPSSAVVTIADINQPIDNTLKLAFRVGDAGQPSKLETSGTIGAIQNRLLDIDHLSAGQKVSFGNVNLASLEPFIKISGGEAMKDFTLAGIVTGDVDLKAANLLPTFATGKVHVQDLKVGGLSDQRALSTSTIDIPLNITNDSAGGDTVYTIKDVSIAIVGLTVTQNNAAVLTNENIHAGISGKVTKKPAGFDASIDQVSATSDSGLFNVAKAGTTPFMVMLDGSAMKGAGTIAVTADLKRNAQLAEALGFLKLDADQPRLTAGQLDGTLAIKQAEQTQLIFAGTMSGLNVGSGAKQILTNESLKLSASVSAPSDANAKTPMMIAATVDSAFAKANISDAKLDLTQREQPLARLQSANITATVPDAVKLAALVNSLDPVLGTLAVTSGSADIALAVKHADANLSNVELSKFQIVNLGLARGKRTYSFDQTPIALSMAADVKTAGDKIASVKINKLTGDLRVANLSMPQPITIADPLGTAAADGAIQLTGSIDALTPLLSVIQDADPLPYRGDYKLSQTVVSKSGMTALDGGVEINKLVMLDAQQKPTFSEDQVSIKNSLDLDPAKHNATIKTLTVDMPKTQALGLKLVGQVRDWSGACAIAGVNASEAQLDLTYDADKLWQLAKPMLAPETQTQYKDLKVAGKFSKTFKVSGNYNLTKPGLSAAQRLSGLKSSGSLALDLLDLPQGLTLKAFELPFTLEKGVLRTQAAADNAARKISAGGDGKARLVKTAICNDGALNLDGMAIELNYADPLLSIEKKHVLLNDVALNNVLADTIGNGNLIFKDASQASGLLDVTVVDCKRVPLGDLITTKKNASAQVVFSVQKLSLDSLPIQLLSQGLRLGGNGISGSINNGTLTLSQGRVDSNFAINIDQTRQVKQSAEEGGGKRSVTNQLPLEFGGGVVLASGALKDFVVNIPAGLIPAKSIGNTDISKLLPNGLVVPFSGTTSKPSLDVAGAVTRSLGDSFLGGNGNPEDALKNLGDLLGKKKKSR